MILLFPGLRAPQNQKPSKKSLGAEALFDLDGEYKSKIDFTKTDNPKVRALLNMKVLLLDEVSMLPSFP